MKSVKQTLLTRRTIRRYERKTIEQHKIDFIFDAIRNTQTSYNGQQFTVIETSNQQIKEQLYEMTGQKQIKTSALFLVFCVDFNKLRVGAQAKGLCGAGDEANGMRFRTIAAQDGSAMPVGVADQLDGYTVAVIDASLAMQNAVVAAESMDLGTCCIGYTRTSRPFEIAKLLQLPQGVAVVCGLAIGYPSEMPDMKPKLPMSLVIHKDHYRTDDMSADILAYDREVSNYNAERSGDKSANDWLKHILTYNAEQHQLDEYLRSQGIEL